MNRGTRVHPAPVAGDLAVSPGTGNATVCSPSAQQSHSSSQRAIFVFCGAPGDEEAHLQTLKIIIGDGHQSVKWLALTSAQKVSARRHTGGRIQARAPPLDGRDNSVPVPQRVTAGRQNKWVHPSTKVIDLLNRYGSGVKIVVELEYRPRLNQGMHERTMWGDLAFGGERGEERYQTWVAMQRSKGLRTGTAMSDEDEDENEDEDGGDTGAGGAGGEGVSVSKTAVELAEERRKREFERVWSQVSLQAVIRSDNERQRTQEYVYKHFATLRGLFRVLALAHLYPTALGASSSPATSPAASPASAAEKVGEQSEDDELAKYLRLSLSALVHFAWQHELELCATGVRRTVDNKRDDAGDKALAAQRQEEDFIHACALEVQTFAQGGAGAAALEESLTASAKASKKKRGGGGGAAAAAALLLDGEGGQVLIDLTLPNFLEFIVRYTVRKRDCGGGRPAGGSYANAVAVRQTMQRLEAPGE